MSLIIKPNLTKHKQIYNKDEESRNFTFFFNALEPKLIIKF